VRETIGEWIGGKMEARARITRDCKRDWKITATKPAGGYVPIKADHLLQAWLAYREGTIHLFDLRVWLWA